MARGAIRYLLLAVLVLWADRVFAQDAVDGVQLGSKVAADLTAAQGYKCRPSDDFAGLSRCERFQSRRERGALQTVTNTVMHAEGGNVLYVMATQGNVPMTAAMARTEIEQLSVQFKAKPTTIKWEPEGKATSVIVSWGAVKLGELGYEQTGTLAEGKSAKAGLLIDTVGNLTKSAKDNLPIRRLTGGKGYVFAASFDPSGLGVRRQVAIEAGEILFARYEKDLTSVLDADKALPEKDFSLWPKVAEYTRGLSLDTSPTAAKQQMDRIFNRYVSRKLYSPLWPHLPGSAIMGLGAGEYRKLDVYGDKTSHPVVRDAILKFVRDNPTAPFAEFAHYIKGDFPAAIATAPTSVIRSVLDFAMGHKAVERLLEEIIRARGDERHKTDDGTLDVSRTIYHLNHDVGFRTEHKFGTLLPTFANFASDAGRHLELVVQNEKSPHADDAAYFLGWLAFHMNRPLESLDHLHKALIVGNGDYRESGALRMLVPLLERFEPEDLIRRVETTPAFAAQPALRYAAVRAAYRNHKYDLAIAASERALRDFGATVEQLPSTTAPEKIEEALERFDPKLRQNYNTPEIAYVLQASKELRSYKAFADTIRDGSSREAWRRTRSIIMKYSLLIAPPDTGKPPPLAHRDLRQALHLIDHTFARAPKTSEFAPLREWLHYRRVRILVAYAPKEVEAAVAELETEYPKSSYTDDALAELLYVHGRRRNVRAAEATFRKIVGEHPAGNAVDNAHTWMAVIYRCVGQPSDAQRINREIIRRFPLTRHAKYAVERMANTSKDACGLEQLASHQ
jgi:tetratricopeptide (TPR) repeat protein